MIPMMVKMKIKLMVRGDYENSNSANDESEESDLDDIIFGHDESSSMTVVTKIVIVLMMIKRNIVLGQYYLTMIVMCMTHRGGPAAFPLATKKENQFSLATQIVEVKNLQYHNQMQQAASSK